MCASEECNSVQEAFSNDPNTDSWLCEKCMQSCSNGLNTGAHDKDREAQNVEAEPVIVNRSYLIRQSVSQNNEERPFRCNVCLKSFKQVAHLTTHKRIHSDEKPHKCNICGQSFRSSSHLKQHVKIHTGEKPYPCEVCGKSFRQSAHLKNHICRG